MKLRFPYLNLAVLFFATLAMVQIHSGISIAQTTAIDQSQEVEGKNMVGAINGSQLSFHFERQTFSNNINELGVSFPDNPYYGEPIIKATDTLATVIVKAAQEGLRSFSAATTYTSGQYIMIICQTNSPSNLITPPAVQNNQLVCPAGSQEIR